jgi:hypothetical protein
VSGVRPPGSTHVREMIKQASRSGVFHGHSFPMMSVN